MARRSIRTGLVRIATALLLLAVGSCGHAPPAKPATTQPLASPRDLPGLPNFAQVSPVLYRGAQPTPKGFNRLKTIGVKTVVDLRAKGNRDELEGKELKDVHLPFSAARLEGQKVVHI